MRWSSINGPLISPDGEKLVFSRRNMGIPGYYSLYGALAPVTGGSFTISVGAWPTSLGAAYTTADIPWNATAEEVWNAVNLLPNVEDPRIHGFTGAVWAGGPLPVSMISLRFDALPPLGVWMTTHSSLTPSGTFSVAHNFEEVGTNHWYICNHDGSDLTEIEFEFEVNYIYGFSPDSTKVMGFSAESDSPSGRWFIYDISTEEVTHPLTDWEDSDNGILLSRPLYSPDNKLLVWVADKAGIRSLWTWDTTDTVGSVKQYENTIDSSSDDQDSLYLSNLTIWSFDSQKLALIDDRDAQPIWLFNIPDNTMTKVWPGAGWTDWHEQKWIFDSLEFDG